MNEGRIEDEGAPERVYARPATRFAATFMGESTLLSGMVTAAGNGAISIDTTLGPVTLAGNAAPGAAVWLAIRPEHLQFGEAADKVRLGEAQVKNVVFQGSFKRVLASSANDPAVDFVIKLAANAPVRQGETVALCCRAADIIVLTE
jgi:spermidine/putrescine transport system ATP-binding protein